MAKYFIAHLIGCIFTTIINLKYHNMMIRILPFLVLPLLGMGQTNSKVEMPMGENTTREKQALEIKRNAFYNLEELKVRWKKAALENCPGVPCVTVTVPGSPTIVNVVAGNTQATVSFTAPSSTGGSAITSYTVASTPVGGTGTGTGSPITVNGLSNGTSYTFIVIATNAVGSSLASAASSAVTPVAACSAGAASSTPTLAVNTALTNITHTTTNATGIGTALGLPAGVNAAWSGGVITISGTPTAPGTFYYTIPLTGTSCSSVNATGTITVSAPSFTCGTSTVTDVDGHIYNTFSIGTGTTVQCWTASNLKVTKYNDGSLIGDSTTSTWGTAVIGARTGYDVSLVTLSDYVGTFGYLYNWYAVNDLRKLCPAGWHVPTDAEWTNLIQFIDPTASVTVGVQSSTAGTVMKSTVTNSSIGSGLGWDPGIPGTNTSGFTALPGGGRISGSFFSDISISAFFWSATEFGASAWNRTLDAYSSNVHRFSVSKSVGASVRCLKD
jgi:uncharacterized protein (TIGR02145 family)